MERQQPKRRLGSAEKRRLGGVEKLLLGCALGCGVLVLAGLVAGGFGAWWVFSPGEQIATGQIVGEETLGMVRMNELATDEGTQELLTKLLTTFNEIHRRQQDQALPDSMKWLTRLQRSPRASDFNQFIPKEATLVLEPALDGDEPVVVVAVNFRTMVRPIKAMLALASQGEGNENFRAKYRGHDVFRLDDTEEGTLAFVGSTLLFGSDRGTLERAIDRVEGEAASVVSGAGRRLVQGFPEGDWDATGTLGNDYDVVVGLLRRLLDDETFEAPEGTAEGLDFHFGLDVVSADEMAARAVLDCGDAARAAAWLAALEERIPAAEQRARGLGLELAVDVKSEGPRVLTELRLTGVSDAIERTIQVDFEADSP